MLHSKVLRENIMEKLYFKRQNIVNKLENRILIKCHKNNSLLENHSVVPTYKIAALRTNTEIHLDDDYHK